ncbi:hypothetical protein BG844_18610 [Couchioplanes caeruleus subsp. caeruleus]|uniref:2-polyprenyl-6-methoxyphenol hydroxylase-like FAD-dependent oxidoreductase n=2 Tax=Couchioplanes caeruleus TaxID=56438 RepID=A0A1K0GU25_9ACTN|nr:hypothetical protein BG844_18610 [Couchioplanes caeruleus subsp. caeruleus]
MIAAATLAAYGYSVLAIERRKEFSRNIQWAGRQSFINQLSFLNRDLADEFLRKTCGPISLGSTRVDVDGIRVTKQKPLPAYGDPWIIPDSAYDMLEEPACFLVGARRIEMLLRRYLDGLPNVTTVRGEVLNLMGPDAAGRFSLPEIGKPSLIVVAEGASSRTASRLGLESAPTSPARLQIAGQIGLGGDGSMVKQLHREEADVSEVGTISQRGLGRTWVVGDVGPAAGVRTGEDGTTEFDARMTPSSVAAMSKETLARKASVALDVPVSRIMSAGVEGPTTSLPHPRFFSLQQRLMPKAYAGTNLVLMGDTVGTGHWNEGGGMQVGAICHVERLKTLLREIDGGEATEAAVQRYSSAVLDDSQAWGEKGITSFHPLDDADTVLAAYRAGVGAFRRGETDSPLTEIQSSIRDGVCAAASPAGLLERCISA